MAKIKVQNAEISVVSYNDNDYISLTDMARSQMQDHIIFRWLSLKSTLEYIGEWEILYNPILIVPNSVQLKIWREQHPELKGNIRDYASINELICLSNMENLNAVFIDQGMSQHERIFKLNQIAIQQMQILEDGGNRKLLK